jgi:hypothetical protein
MRPQFLAKARDSVYFTHKIDKGTVYLSFMGAGEFYDDLTVGHRYRLFNLEVDGTLRAERKVLHITRRSAIRPTNLKYTVAQPDLDFTTAFISAECQVNGVMDKMLYTISGEIKGAIVSLHDKTESVTVNLHDPQFFGEQNSLRNKQGLDISITHVIKTGKGE